MEMMPQANTRLRRLLAEELGECGDEDVDQRVNELTALAESTARDDSVRAVFAVLGDETRFRLARVLAGAAEELCVCELETLVDVSESAVSHALSDLVDAGLAMRRKDGNWRYYDATDLTVSLFQSANRAVTNE